MKIQVDGEHLFELSEIQKQVICHDISEDILDADMKRRLEYILMHKYEQCFKRLKEKWEPILAKRQDSIPTNPDEFAKLVLSQPDYECRKVRDEKDKMLKAN